MREIDKLTGGEPIIGRRKNGGPADEREHFYVCVHCGQPVDMRDLAPSCTTSRRNTIPCRRKMPSASRAAVTF